MKRVFLDTNVMLDLLGEREPFYKPAAQLATLADQQKLTLVVSALSYATVNYFLTKYENAQIAQWKLRQFKVLSVVSPLDDHVVQRALNSAFSDFEDALQYFSALASASDVIVTRNAKDFKKSELPVMNAVEYLQSLKKVD